MATEITGVISWLRDWFDGIYELNSEKITLDDIYPVGSIYMSMSSTDPSTLFGGTWVRLTDTFLLAAGTTYNADANATTAQHGAATVTLTAAQSGIPAHGHGMAHTHNHRHKEAGQYSSGSGSSAAYAQTANRTAKDWYTGYDNTASNKSTTDNNTASNASETHNNMPPYLAVYMWKRTQ